MEKFMITAYNKLEQRRARFSGNLDRESAEEMLQDIRNRWRTQRRLQQWTRARIEPACELLELRFAKNE